MIREAVITQSEILNQRWPSDLAMRLLLVEKEFEADGVICPELKGKIVVKTNVETGDLHYYQAEFLEVLDGIS